MLAMTPLSTREKLDNYQAIPGYLLLPSSAKLKC